MHKLELKVKREARPMQIVNRLGPVAKRRFQQATPSVKAEAERRERRRRAAAETAARQREQRARRFVLSTFALWCTLVRLLQTPPHL